VRSVVDVWDVFRRLDADRAVATVSRLLAGRQSRSPANLALLVALVRQRYRSVYAEALTDEGAARVAEVQLKRSEGAAAESLRDSSRFDEVRSMVASAARSAQFQLYLMDTFLKVWSLVVGDGGDAGDLRYVSTAVADTVSDGSAASLVGRASAVTLMGFRASPWLRARAAASLGGRVSSLSLDSSLPVPSSLPFLHVDLRELLSRLQVAPCASLVQGLVHLRDERVLDAVDTLLPVVCPLPDDATLPTAAGPEGGSGTAAWALGSTWGRERGRDLMLHLLAASHAAVGKVLDLTLQSPLRPSLAPVAWHQAEAVASMARLKASPAALHATLGSMTGGKGGAAQAWSQDAPLRVVAALGVTETVQRSLAQLLLWASYNVVDVGEFSPPFVEDVLRGVGRFPRPDAWIDAAMEMAGPGGMARPLAVAASAVCAPCGGDAGMRDAATSAVLSACTVPVLMALSGALSATHAPLPALQSLWIGVRNLGAAMAVTTAAAADWSAAVAAGPAGAATVLRPTPLLSTADAATAAGGGSGAGPHLLRSMTRHLDEWAESGLRLCRWLGRADGRNALGAWHNTVNPAGAQVVSRWEPAHGYSLQHRVITYLLGRPVMHAFVVGADAMLSGACRAAAAAALAATEAAKKEGAEEAKVAAAARVATDHVPAACALLGMAASFVTAVADTVAHVPTHRPLERLGLGGMEQFMLALDAALLGTSPASAGVDEADPHARMKSSLSHLAHTVATVVKLASPAGRSRPIVMSGRFDAVAKMEALASRFLRKLRGGGGPGGRRSGKALRVGDRVRVRRAITSVRYGWGSVTHESVGKLVSIDGEDCRIDFPGFSGWMGYLPEIESASGAADGGAGADDGAVAPSRKPGGRTGKDLRVGDLVHVKASVETPAYGWGSVTHASVGTIESIAAPDSSDSSDSSEEGAADAGGDMDCVVNFPGASGWSGKLSELEEDTGGAGDEVAVAAPAAATAPVADGTTAVSNAARADPAAEALRDEVVASVVRGSWLPDAPLWRDAVVTAFAPRWRGHVRDALLSMEASLAESGEIMPPKGTVTLMPGTGRSDSTESLPLHRGAVARCVSSSLKDEEWLKDQFRWSLRQGFAPTQAHIVAMRSAYARFRLEALDEMALAVEGALRRAESLGGVGTVRRALGGMGPSAAARALVADPERFLAEHGAALRALDALAPAREAAVVRAEALSRESAVVDLDRVLPLLARLENFKFGSIASIFSSRHPHADDKDSDDEGGGGSGGGRGGGGGGGDASATKEAAVAMDEAADTDSDDESSVRMRAAAAPGEDVGSAKVAATKAALARLTQPVKAGVKVVASGTAAAATEGAERVRAAAEASASAVKGAAAAASAGIAAAKDAVEEAVESVTDKARAGVARATDALSSLKQLRPARGLMWSMFLLMNGRVGEGITSLIERAPDSMVVGSTTVPVGLIKQLVKVLSGGRQWASALGTHPLQILRSAAAADGSVRGLRTLEHYFSVKPSQFAGCVHALYGRLEMSVPQLDRMVHGLFALLSGDLLSGLASFLDVPREYLTLNMLELRMLHHPATKQALLRMQLRDVDPGLKARLQGDLEALGRTAFSRVVNAGLGRAGRAVERAASAAVSAASRAASSAASAGAAAAVAVGGERAGGFVGGALALAAERVAGTTALAVNKSASTASRALASAGMVSDIGDSLGAAVGVAMAVGSSVSGGPGAVAGALVSAGVVRAEQTGRGDPLSSLLRDKKALLATAIGIVLRGDKRELMRSLPVLAQALVGNHPKLVAALGIVQHFITLMEAKQDAVEQALEAARGAGGAARGALKDAAASARKWVGGARSAGAQAAQGAADAAGARARELARRLQTELVARQGHILSLLRELLPPEYHPVVDVVGALLAMGRGDPSGLRPLAVHFGGLSEERVDALLSMVRSAQRLASEHGLSLRSLSGDGPAMARKFIADQGAALAGQAVDMAKEKAREALEGVKAQATSAVAARFASLPLANGRMSEAAMDILFSTLDMDGSESLSLDEFVDMTRHMNLPLSMPKLKGIFAELDKDGSFTLSREEFRAGMKKLLSEVVSAALERLKLGWGSIVTKLLGLAVVLVLLLLFILLGVQAMSTGTTFGAVVNAGMPVAGGMGLAASSGDGDIKQKLKEKAEWVATKVKEAISSFQPKV
jgi:hypothetical protein